MLMQLGTYGRPICLRAAALIMAIGQWQKKALRLMQHILCDGQAAAPLLQSLLNVVQ